MITKNEEEPRIVGPGIRGYQPAGGEVVAPPFDIQIGRCAVVRDPWNNELVLLDTSKSLLESDSEGNVLGNTQPTWHHAFQGGKGNCYRQNLGRNHPLNNTFGV